MREGERRVGGRGVEGGGVRVEGERVREREYLRVRGWCVFSC